MVYGSSEYAEVADRQTWAMNVVDMHRWWIVRPGP